MVAFEYFSDGTTNVFISNIKTKAEAYGWVIDRYETGRLHLHNGDGAHFELWYASAAAINIVGCTGYNAGAAPAAQPGVSATCQITASQPHYIVIGPHAIFIKVYSNGNSQNMHFGSVVDKVGAWTGGAFISSTMSYVGAYAYNLWGGPYREWSSQMLINGAWSHPRTDTAGGVYGICEGELFGKMPFAYSGGILPCPLLLVRNHPTAATYLEPLGFAPDARLFRGGDVYKSNEEIVINGEKWVCLSQGEATPVFTAAPDLLIRLAA